MLFLIPICVFGTVTILVYDIGEGMRERGNVIMLHHIKLKLTMVNGVTTTNVIL